MMYYICSFVFAEEIGHASGVLKMLPANTQLTATVDIMIAEAMKTSELEGEYLSRKDVAPSIRNKPGLNIPSDTIKDKMAKGAGELMVIKEKKLFSNKELFTF